MTRGPKTVATGGPKTEVARVDVIAGEKMGNARIGGGASAGRVSFPEGPENSSDGGGRRRQCDGERRISKTDAGMSHGNVWKVTGVMTWFAKNFSPEDSGSTG